MKYLIFVLCVSFLSATMIGQSTSAQQFQAFTEGYSDDGGTIVALDFTTDYANGEGGSTALGFLYFIQFDSTSTFTTYPDLLEDVVVYPNPGVRFTIEFESPAVNEVLVDVYAMNGTSLLTLKQTVVPSGMNRIFLNATEWSSGVYGLLMRDLNGNVLHKQMIAVQ